MCNVTETTLRKDLSLSHPKEALVAARVSLDGYYEMIQYRG
jgi:hypothetical protein